MSWKQWSVSLLSSLAEVLGAVAWPILVVTLFLLVRSHLPTIGNEFRRWLEQRDVSAELAGAKIGTAISQQKQQKAPVDVELGPSATEKSGPSDPRLEPKFFEENESSFRLPPTGRPELDWRESDLWQDLSEIPAEQHVGRLVRTLADANQRLFNEWIYNRILGSQHALLKSMSVKPFIVEKDVHSLFKAVMEAFPEMSEEKYHDWIGWLEGSMLIEKKDGQYFLTAYGHDFLSYAEANFQGLNRQF